MEGGGGETREKVEGDWRKGDRVGREEGREAGGEGGGRGGREVNGVLGEGCYLTDN